MITRVQTQPSQNTFGTRIHKSLDGMLTPVAKRLAEIDGNDTRTLSFKPYPYIEGVKMLAMTVKDKGTAFFGLFTSPENIRHNLSECISRFPDYLNKLEKNAHFLKN